MRKMSTLQSLPRQNRQQLQRFLTHLANLDFREKPEGAEDLRKRFPEFFVGFSLDSPKAKFWEDRLEQLSRERLSFLIVGVREDHLSELAKPSENQITDQIVMFLSKCVQQAWVAPDPRTREWKTFVLRVQVWGLLLPDRLGGWEGNLPADPPRLPLDMALAYLQNKGHLARRCALDDCFCPYFFATRKNQKFCTAECAAPSKRAAKRLWAEKNRAKGKR